MQHNMPAIIHQADLKCYNINSNVKGSNYATYYNRDIEAMLKYAICKIYIVIAFWKDIT